MRNFVIYICQYDCRNSEIYKATMGWVCGKVGEKRKAYRILERGISRKTQVHATEGEVSTRKHP